MDLMFAPLRKYADFEGRARRAEYWLFILLSLLVFTGLFSVALIGDLTMPDYAESPLPMAVIAGCLGWILASFIPGLAVSVRRLHNINQSGVWVLAVALPFGGLALLVMSLIDGTPTRNKYGDDPKVRDALTAPSPSGAALVRPPQASIVQ